MKKHFLLLLTLLLCMLTGFSLAEGVSQADLEWAAGVTDQSALTLAEQAKYLAVLKQQNSGIALYAVGEVDQPYQIANAAQLAELAAYVNADNATFNAAHYVQVQDIDLSGYANWTPIGIKDHPFMGVYDGQEHIVSGLTISRPEEGYQGLFGSVYGQDADHKAQLKNIIVKDARIQAKRVSGAVVGQYGDFMDWRREKTEPLVGCTMVGGIVIGDGSGANQSSMMGGVVGDACVDVQYCYATGTVVVPAHGIEFGGVVGYATTNISSCYAAGSMQIERNSGWINDIGGVAGVVAGDISDCYSTVNVIGDNDVSSVGGVAGNVVGKVIRCYATGNVEGYHSIGSVVGYSDGGITSSVGMGASVSGGVSVARVGNYNSSSTASGNYAEKSMVLTNRYGSSSSKQEDGSDLTYDPATGLDVQFQTIFGNNDAWNYTANGLPTLKNVGGTQSSALPVRLSKTVPTKITTAQELRDLAEAVNNNWINTQGMTFTLENDIDLAELNGDWTPIGQRSFFQGVFDGQGHTISNLTIQNASTDYQGLFKWSSGVIQNVVVKNAQITSTAGYVGAIVAYNGGGRVENCAMVGGSVQGSQFIGGVVGSNEEGTISRCYATGDVTATYQNAGGITGGNTAGTVERCYATGNVTAVSSSAGGITGTNNTYSAEARTVVQNCYATANVTSKWLSGGIVGHHYGSIIRGCYATGIIKATDGDAGGITPTNIVTSINLTSTTENCVALNPSVTAPATAYRVNETSGGSFAWAGMTVNGGNTVVDGTDLTYDSTTQTLNKSFADMLPDTSVWENLSNSGLPTLKDVGGPQSTALPPWITASTETYFITTAEQLAQLAQQVNNGTLDTNGKTYVLLNDLDLSAYAAGEGWTPIGNAAHDFKGVFDGNGKTIRGLTIHRADRNQGLFGWVYDGQIKNLKLENPTVEGTWYVGAIAAFYQSNHPLENCAVLGGSVTATADGESYAGGLVGYIEAAISNCYTTCSVSGANNVGGLAGFTMETVVNCYATGNVSGAKFVGGLIGTAHDEVAYCYAAGIVTGEFAVGGVVGSLTMLADFHDCVALNAEIRTTDSWAGRVTDSLEGNPAAAKVSGLYAWSGMLVGGQTVTGTQRDEQGEDLLGHQGLFYTSSGQFGWPGFDTSIWELRNDQPNKLPRLISLGGDPWFTLPLQGSETRFDVMLTAGTGISGFRYRLANAADYTDYTGTFQMLLSDVLEIQATVLPGYDFDQWDDGYTGSTIYLESIRANLNLYASAKPQVYAIIYEGAEGASFGPNHPTTHTYGTDTAVSDAARTGKTFLGWQVNHAGTPAKDLTLAADGYLADITLTAMWSDTPYTVTVKDSYAKTSGAGTYVMGDTVKLDAGLRAGYTFLGWQVEAGGVTLPEADKVQTTFTMPAANVTVTAVWEKEKELPRTGDHSPLLLWGLLLGASLAAMAGMRRKKA